jgi:hypothetical protein
MRRAKDRGVQGPHPHGQVIAEAAAAAQQIAILDSRKRPSEIRATPAGLAHHRAACQDKVGPRVTAATGSTVSSSGTPGEMRAVSKWPISSLIPVFSHPQHRKGSTMRPQTMSCLITADILLTFFLRHFCFDIGGCGRSGGSRGARNDCFTNFGKHAVFGKTRFKHNRRPSDFFPTGGARTLARARSKRSIDFKCSKGGSKVEAISCFNFALAKKPHLFRDARS